MTRSNRSFRSAASDLHRTIRGRVLFVRNHAVCAIGGVTSAIVEVILPKVALFFHEKLLFVVREF
ncbi:MAG: hypothetical protein Q8914_14480, partial [Bacteroidota bacterium]|nr:hypothetical protein [Bacteroidota bacterium]